MSKTALVVSAHPGDFVWRAGGAIALHARKGYRVKIVCLAFGERGESQFAWKQPGMTLDKVKAGRRDEAERAAAALGAEIEFFDAGDYPLRLTDAHMERLIDIYREINPSFVLTHALDSLCAGGAHHRAGDGPQAAGGLQLQRTAGVFV